MIKSILHLLKIHRKVIFGNPTIVVQNMLGVTPKALNAVDMVLASVGKGLAMIQAVMLAPAFERVVTPECVSVVDRSLPRMLPDMSHEFVGSNSLYHLGVHPAVTLQKAKYNAFSSRTPSALAFASATEVGLVNLDFTLKLACLQFGN